MRVDEFDIAGASDIGKKRSENQDHFLIADLRRQLVVRQSDIAEDDQGEIFGCQEGHLLVVADGMGGHDSGEVASRKAVQASAKYVLDMMHWFLKLTPRDEDDFVDELANCLRSIQEQIWSESPAGQRRMGTTVTMAYVLWPKLYIVHAGDSRCYMMRRQNFQQLTTDHTIAQRLVSTGTLTEEEAAKGNWGHVLWNCVGGGEDVVQPEVIRCDLKEDDTLLLCSDGLTGMLSDETIRRVVLEQTCSRSTVETLVREANDAGGKDNISVVVCRFNHPRNCNSFSDANLCDTTIS